MDEQNYYTGKWEPPYRAMDIAQYILKKSMQDKHPVTHLQLQRILYYVYRENIKNGRKLFKEQFEWCKFGPIIQCIYDTFVGSEAAPIIYLSKKCPVISNEDKQIIDRAIENARDKNFQDIAKDLHEENVWYQNRIMEILNYGKDEPESNIHIAQSYCKEDPRLVYLSKMCAYTSLVYDTETGVEYIQSCQRGGYTYTVRLDKSGNPCVYEEYK